jgi:hypothetical protein
MGDRMGRKTLTSPEMGWTYRGEVEDLGDLVGHCDACGRENQHRYRHPLEHPGAGLRADVGRGCAERLTGDRVGPGEREEAARKRARELERDRTPDGIGGIRNLANWTEAQPGVREFGLFQLRGSRFAPRWAVFLNGLKIDGYRHTSIGSAHRRAVELSGPGDT